ncbi:MAG: hypothetical protein L6Q97_21315 [Thermoanaerobaculia bacterium]|nr:hypothetical protein [Thermoanaerobaculia bacterium]
MSEKYFDRQIKQTLEGLEVPYDPGTWNLLERRLDALVAEEHPAPVEQIDKMVYHTLERLEAPYQAAHWELLVQQMQRQSGLIRRVRLTKLAEAAILLLLLANLNVFPGFQPEVPDKPKPHSIQRPDVPVASAHPGQKQRSIRSAGSAAQQFPVAGAGKGNLFPSFLSGPTAAGLLDPGYRSAQSVSELMNDLQQVADKDRQRVADNLPSAEFLPFNMMAALDVPARAADMPAAPVRKFREKGPLYLSTFASADQHLILVNGERKPGSGYGAGVAVGARKGKWGAEAGIVYGHNSYEPQKKVEFYKGNVTNGYYGSTLTRVQTDMVSVPLKVNRQVARAGNTSVRAVAGVTASFAMQKAFDYGTITYNDPNPPSTQPGGNPKLRQQGRGVLENGGLSGNVYATFDAGVRIEHPIGRGRYTAFIEPGFRQSLTRKGTGPNREPLNTVTLQAGVMAFL